MAPFFGRVKSVYRKYRDALTILNWCNRLSQRTVKTSMSALRTSLFIGSPVLFMGRATTSPAQAAKPSPPTPIDLKKAELGGTPWNPQWDQIIEKALPPEMLSSQLPRASVDSARDFTRWTQQTNARFGLTSSRRLQALKPA
jgi:hypothetical protein